MRRGYGLSITGLTFLTLASAALLSPDNRSHAAVPPPTLVPLNQIAIPEPPNLYQFVKNKPAAIRLGKALFWDMQVGSDGVMACATCHFRAGADPRMKNSVHPGKDGVFNVRRPNETLVPSDFPFHQRSNPDSQLSTILRDSDDIFGSQGVRLTQFRGIVPGSAVDAGDPIPDPVFQADGINMRRVTGRNAPTIINAVFNFSNFWDGRAHFEFNGQNPFGPLDTSAGVWFNRNGTLVKEPVRIMFGSLASQATGPALDDTEMSYRGRTFPELGRKLLHLTPLGKQIVHPEDSALGTMSRATLQENDRVTGQKGLNATYAQMIKAAFVNNLWDSAPQAVTLPTVANPGGEQFSQMEANFALFWGLAIQLYEATLVSDQTPFDRFLGGDQTALSVEQQDGFDIFFGAGRCDLCHSGSELTKATVGFSRFLTNADNGLIDQAAMASGRRVIYDDAFTNTAVRPTTDDLARGKTAPFINPLTGQNFPLSFSRLAGLQAQGLLPFESVLLPAFLPPSFPVGVDGFFKIPTLRNVELTTPYMHNGGMFLLEDVVDFYTRGGDFPGVNRDNLDINIIQIDTLQNAPEKMAHLHAFMNSFTDERVRLAAEPFDHPELFVPEGDPEVLTRIAATDAYGDAAITSNFSLDAIPSPITTTSQLVSGTKDAGMTIGIKLNSGPVLPPDTSTDTTWSAVVTGLVPGSNSLSVTATDAGGATTLNAVITVVAAPPALTLNTVSTPTRLTTQGLSGTMGAGATVQVKVNSTSIAVTTPTATTWAATATGLAEGANSLSVTAIDPSTEAAATVTSSIFVDTVAPAVDLKPVATPTGLTTQTVSGTVDAGITPVVTVEPAAAAIVTVNGTAWSAVITGLAQGNNTVTVSATDLAGNRSTASGTIRVDTTAPVDGSMAATPDLGKVTLSWNGFSDPGTGIRQYWLVYATGAAPASCASGNLLPTPAGQTSYVHTGLGNGTPYYYRLCAVDNVGNVSAGVTASATPKDVPPAGSVVINSGAAYTNARTRLVTLSLSATDNGGVSGMCISNTATCTKWVPFAAAADWKLATGQGERTVNVWFRDNAGNVNAAPYTAKIMLDTIAPALTVTVPAPSSGPTQTLTGTVEAGATVEVTFAGATAAAEVTGTTWSHTVSGLVAGTNTVTVTAKDAAGNVSKKKMVRIKRSAI